MEIAAAREAPSRSRFIELAHACGFALAGVAPARSLPDFSVYQDWVAAGMAGPMGYLTDHRMAVRSDARQLLESARSVLCLGMLYNSSEPGAAGVVGQAFSLRGSSDPQKPSVPLEPHAEPAEAGSQAESLPHHAGRARSSSSGVVSRYAWGSGDYHDVLRSSLETLAQRLQAIWGEFEYRVCIDTAPLLERSFAHAAGLGWIGRNTCLINEPLGSWFFLGEILISLELPLDAPPPDRCGTCMRCIDACPTRALIPVAGSSGSDWQPKWQLDARLCISTLTIEQKGATPEATRPGTGDHLFGCDICQDVCPWNRRAPLSAEPAFQPLNSELDLEAMAALTRDEFRMKFRSTPLWRAKFEGWLRNVATVMGNSGDSRYIEPLRALASSDDLGIAAHAAWALLQLEAQATDSEAGKKERQ